MTPAPPSGSVRNRTRASPARSASCWPDLPTNESNRRWRCAASRSHAYFSPRRLGACVNDVRSVSAANVVQAELVHLLCGAWQTATKSAGLPLPVSAMAQTSRPSSRAELAPLSNAASHKVAKRAGQPKLVLASAQSVMANPSNSRTSTALWISTLPRQ